jgi:hypothetical protein
MYVKKKKNSEKITFYNFQAFYNSVLFLMFKIDQLFTLHSQYHRELRPDGICKLPCMVPEIKALTFIYFVTVTTMPLLVLKNSICRTYFQTFFFCYAYVLFFCSCFLLLKANVQTNPVLLLTFWKHGLKYLKYIYINVFNRFINNLKLLLTI